MDARRHRRSSARLDAVWRCVAVIMATEVSGDSPALSWKGRGCRRREYHCDQPSDCRGLSVRGRPRQCSLVVREHQVCSMENRRVRCKSDRRSISSHTSWTVATRVTLRNRGTPSGFSTWLAPLMSLMMGRAIIVRTCQRRHFRAQQNSREPLLQHSPVSEDSLKRGSSAPTSNSVSLTSQTMTRAIWRPPCRASSRSGATARAPSVA
jgi:hypothetical protein